MYYLIHTMDIDSVWADGPACKGEVLMMSSSIKELQKKLEAIYTKYTKKCDYEDMIDYDCGRGYGYLAYFEYGGKPTKHVYVICKEKQKRHS